jgi:hypothetical protein
MGVLAGFGDRRVLAPDAKQQRLRLSVPRRKRAWFSGLWANAAAPRDSGACQRLMDYLGSYFLESVMYSERAPG